MAKLTFILDDEQEIEVPLSDRITIGRVDGNDVVVDDPRMSSRHAEVRRIGEGIYEVHDLGSKGGTFINGERVERQKLHNGDKVGFGPLQGVFVNKEEPGPVEQVAHAAEFTVLPGGKKPSKPEAKGDISSKPEKASSRHHAKVEAPSAKLPPALVGQAAAGSRFEEEAREAIVQLQRAKVELQAEISAMQSDVKDLQGRRNELSNVESKHREIEARLRHTVEEVEVKTQRVSSLAKEEKRLGHVTDALSEAESRLAGLQEKIQELTAEKQVRQAETLQQEQAIENARQEFAALSASLDATRARLQTVQDEAEGKTQQVIRLVTEEKRLEHIPQALKDAEALHLHWLESIATLKVQHGLRQTDWEKLQAEAESAQQEVWQLNASKEQAQVQLQGLKEDEEGLVARLEELQRQTTDAETRARESLDIAEAREDQVRNAEKKLHSLEQQRSILETYIAEFSDTEKKLEFASAELKKTEGLHAALLATVAFLEERSQRGEVKAGSVESRLAGLESQQAALESKVATAKSALATDDQALLEFREQAEITRKKLEGERAVLEQDLSSCRDALKQEKTELADVTAKRAEIKRQCEDLVEIESKLNRTKESLQQAESRLAELQARQREIESKLTAAKSSLATDDQVLVEFKKQAAITREQLQGEHAGLEKEITQCRDVLKQEKSELVSITAKHAEIKRQCEELATTEQNLAGAKATLARAESRVIQAESRHKELDEEHREQQNQINKLHQEEDEAKARLEDLSEREDVLRRALVEIVEQERTDRERFEAIRKLTAEAEVVSHQQKAELASHLEQTRRELAGMENKLSPMREWKESMDKRYARLASLPENSDEALELWREIETEKNNIRKTMQVSMPAPTPAPSVPVKQGGNIRDLVLRTRPGAKADENSLAPVQSARSSSEVIAPDERAAIGTGSLISGTGQEMALNARLNRLRESVAREATRLEFLRQERSREEMRGKSGSPATGSALKEQERQLEIKVRREEERLATIERKIEVAEMDEDKRRERVAELEHKLSALKSDIAETERDRSDALQKSEAGQVKPNSSEDGRDRLKRMGE